MDIKIYTCFRWHRRHPRHVSSKTCPSVSRLSVCELKVQFRSVTGSLGLFHHSTLFSFSRFSTNVFIIYLNQSQWICLTFVLSRSVIQSVQKKPIYKQKNCNETCDMKWNFLFGFRGHCIMFKTSSMQQRYYFILELMCMLLGAMISLNEASGMSICSWPIPAPWWQLPLSIWRITIEGLWMMKMGV